MPSTFFYPSPSFSVSHLGGLRLFSLNINQLSNMNTLIGPDFDAAFRVWFPYVLSVVTLTQAHMAGSKHKHAWSLGMVNQLLWLLFIFYTETYGLLVLNIGLWIVYIRNHLLWYKEGRSEGGLTGTTNHLSHVHGLANEICPSTGVAHNWATVPNTQNPQSLLCIDCDSHDYATTSGK